MAEEDTNAAPTPAPAPFFRANKRRKVYRQRSQSQAEDNDNDHTSARPEEEKDSLAQQAVVRPAARPQRHGITFTNTSIPRKEKDEEEEVEEKALVPVEPLEQDVEAVTGTGRFVKPMGRVAVEDRHMMAYIDSKLGRQESPATMTTTPTTATTQAPNSAQLPATESNTTTRTESHRAAAQGKVEEVDVASRTTQHPHSRHQPRNLNAAQLQPTPATDPSRRKRRRQPPMPDPTAQARSTLIDEILREGREAHAPAYATPTAQQQQRPCQGEGGGDAGFAPETDAAVAEAFEREFMAEMQERNRRGRPPAMPKDKGVGGIGSKGAETSHGPKLGGSRLQRERFKRHEEEMKRAGK